MAFQITQWVLNSNSFHSFWWLWALTVATITSKLLICIVHHVNYDCNGDYEDVNAWFVLLRQHETICSIKKVVTWTIFNDDVKADNHDDDNHEWWDALQLLAFSWNSLDAKPCLEFIIFTILILWWWWQWFWWLSWWSSYLVLD